MLRARIISTGSYLPEKVLTNYELERMVDTTDEWIVDRTGIKERRIAAPEQNTSDLAYEAAMSALKAAGVKPKKLDLILVATFTPDMLFPSAACTLQNKLGAKNAAALDVNAACSGFTYGLSVANAFIKSSQFGRVLVVGADIMSRVIDYEDRTTCVLFGDGAGAALLEPTMEDRGILSVDIHADGRYGDILMMPGGGSKYPASEESVRNKQHYIKMKGNEVFKVAVKTLEKLVVDTLKKNKLRPYELSLLIPHQANIRIIQATAKRLGISMDRVFLNIEKYGNTSAASIPIALDEAVRSRRVRDGDYILLETFGGGLTWASALVKW